MEKKRQKRDQFVIACLDDREDAQWVMPCAKLCAARLNKGIIALNVAKDGDNGWLKELGVPYVGMKGDWKTAIDGLPNALGGVLAVTAMDRKKLSTYRDCKIAYLFVPKTEQMAKEGGPCLESVALTIDYHRESKEKLVWGSYFVRFFGSRLTVASPEYRDEGWKELWHNNMKFLDKLYNSLGISYGKAMLKSATNKPDQVAMETLNPDLLVTLTTDQRAKDVGDWIMGSAESRLIRKYDSTPILFINQRDDIYVLCD